MDYSSFWNNLHGRYSWTGNVVKVREDQYPKTEKNGFMRSILPDQNINNLLPLYIRSEKRNSKHFLKSYLCHEHLLPVKQMVTTVSSLSFILCRGSSLHISKFKMKVRLQKSPTANTVKNSRWKLWDFLPGIIPICSLERCHLHSTNRKS